jgi:hypothetical protein
MIDLSLDGAFGERMAKEETEQLATRLAAVEETLKQLTDNTKAISSLLTRLGLGRQVQTLQEMFHAQLMKDPRYQPPKRLQRFERQVFSQNGEDGIIQEIFNRIGAESKSFLEIGIEDGRETNTTWLLQKGWRGVWIDGNQNATKRAAREFARPIGEGRLMVETASVTAENIGGLLKKIHFAGEFDLLSLDIDRNTFFVWQALRLLRPRVVVIEYNAIIPPEQDWRVEYVAERGWNGTSYFGASLKAYETLGRELGYCLVGCETLGVNAFFVRQDLVGDHFAAPFTSENHYEPPRYFLVRTVGHPRGFDDAASQPATQR